MNMNINKNQFEELKKAYNEAVKNNEIQFEFAGHLLLVPYAKYLIEHLQSKFN
jgi:hypothetical protein